MSPIDNTASQAGRNKKAPPLGDALLLQPHFVRVGQRGLVATHGFFTVILNALPPFGAAFRSA